MKRTEARGSSGLADADLGRSTTEMLRALAGQWDISYETLFRLLSGSVASVSWRTLLRIERHLTEREREKLRKAALPSRTRRVFRLWAAHVQREIERVLHGTGRRPRHLVVFRWLPPEEQRLLESFRAKVKTGGLPRVRALLGEYRVYDVLVGWDRWRKLLPPGDARRLTVVKLGWRRERALLAAELRLLRSTKPARGS